MDFIFLGLEKLPKTLHVNYFLLLKTWNNLTKQILNQINRLLTCYKEF